MSVIKNVYPSGDNVWIDKIIDLYQTKLDRENISLNDFDSTYQSKLGILNIELRILYDKKEKL